MAYFQVPPSYLSGQDDDACCDECKQTGGSCGSGPAPTQMVGSPQLVQGPWMGPRLDWGIEDYDYRIPQSGYLRPARPVPESWTYRLQNGVDAWQDS